MLVTQPILQYTDVKGKPYAGAKAYFYLTGTTTPVAVYSDNSFTSVIEQPVVANDQGMFPPMFVAPGSNVRLKVTAANGDLSNPLIDVDPVSPVVDGEVYAIYPELFGYTGSDLDADTEAWNKAFAAAANGTLSCFAGKSYTIGTVTILNNCRWTCNNATIHLSGVGAGIYWGASLDYFNASEVKIVGSGVEADAQYGLTSIGSSIEILRGQLDNIYVDKCVQGIETSPFINLVATGLWVEESIGLTAGHGYGIVLGNGQNKGASNPEAMHIYTGIRGARCDRHFFYAGQYTCVILNGAICREHAYNSSTYDFHSAFAISRGGKFIGRAIHGIDCNEELIGIDDDNARPGHAFNIDIEFTNTTPKTKCVALRIGTNSDPTADQGLDNVRVKGMIDLNSDHTVVDVLNYWGTNVELDLMFNGAQAFTADKIAMATYGQGGDVTYFNNHSIKLRGIMTGSGALIPHKLMDPATTMQAVINLENDVVGRTTDCAFQSAPSNDLFTIRSIRRGGSGKNGFIFQSNEQNTTKATLFAKGKAGGYGAGVGALSAASDIPDGPSIDMGNLVWEGEAAFNSTGSTQTAAAILRAIIAGVLTDVVNASGLNKTFKLLNNFQLVLVPTTPASATAPGVAGQIAVDASYIYVCTATDTWKRVAIATW